MREFSKSRRLKTEAADAGCVLRWVSINCVVGDIVGGIY
jgi:hypothetical protein